MHLVRATQNSLAGLAHAWRLEAAVRQEVFILVMSIPTAHFLGVDVFQKTVLVASVIALIVIELLNTCPRSCVTRDGRTPARNSSN